LRRRKVVQWGLVYVAAAWGFLQGLEYVSESFHWPEQLRQIAIIALLVGLPIALVLAWYHGDRGQQRITTSEFAILTLLLLLGGGAFWYYQRASEAGKHAARTAGAVQPDTSPAVTDPRPSVAVPHFRALWIYYRDHDPPSPRSATNPSSKPSSPTSSATWRSRAPRSLRVRRTRRLRLRRLARDRHIDTAS
jgi:hypothetical protein